ncbi:MAG: Fe-S cluster assembly ATPase SufC [Ruminococcus sp.]|uniref:Fe-S cluster assembly ATPase SufC n=1 Tax=Ruminococcus sp. TaxID=41978 RepID=UPI0025D9BDDB|nr:Fe-S cluster assembly ATPase SufC [Ruminococcus sp.]MBO4866455.1 Fe-S cluster assembly ATPase SufC [Ruminococcus sp.]
MSELLRIEDLSAAAEDKELLHGVSLEVSEGETHVVMGHNGAGKSTLGSVIMGSPEYKVTGGKLIFDGEDITALGADKRARLGIFLSFQNPIEIPGITLSDFLRNALEQVTGKHLKLWDFKKKLSAAMELLDMDSSYADRDLNVGFSGGEKKKAEILQLLILEPKLAILDETDSGLDVDAVKTVSKGIEEYKKRTNGALIVITHNTKILEALTVDKTHILSAGSIVSEGGAELVDEVIENGFEQFAGRE